MALSFFNRSNDGEVMALFVAICSQNGEKKSSFVPLSLPEDGCFYRSWLSKRPFESAFNGE